MTEPKFKVGDLVDVRGDAQPFTGVEITEVRFIEKYTFIGRSVSNGFRGAIDFDGWWYTHSGIYEGRYISEDCVFPHNRPGDSFDEIMRELGKPVETGVPA